MSGVVVKGIGAVSPAGWGVAAFTAALDAGVSIATHDLTRSHGGITVRTPVRRVPEPTDKSVVPKHARLRRSSPISRYAAAATTEAIGAERLAAIVAGQFRLGVVCTLMNGCVNYSNRFYGEVLADPLLASPILFPETVFNAPSSHLSALLGSTGPNDTLIGDNAEFATGLEVAAEWLERGEVDGCVVIGAEELDWLSAEALRFHARDQVAAEGAGAVYLECGTHGVRLAEVLDPVGFRSIGGREAALHWIRAASRATDDGHTLLVDGCTGAGSNDRIEERVWSDWRGPRLSPRRLCGESMGAAMAWQVVAAVAALHAGTATRAVVAALGNNEQAAGLVVEI